MSKTAREIPLAGIAVRRGVSTALSIQLYDQIRKLILTGTLKPGTILPASRNLAQELSVSRNTVVSAYDQLTLESYLESQIGSGTRVARRLPEQLLVAEREFINPS